MKQNNIFNYSACIIVCAMTIFSQSSNAEVLLHEHGEESYEIRSSTFDYNALLNKSNRTGEESYFLAYALDDKNDELDITMEPCDYIKFMEEAADKNISNAKEVMSRLYYGGDSYYCIERDREKAEQYLVSAAEDGYINAQADLGRSFAQFSLRSYVEEPDYQKARYWLEKAAEHQNAAAADALARLYREGKGGEEDPEKSFEMRLVAANAEYEKYADDYFHPLAQYYEEGYGTERNLTLAYKYYDLSHSDADMSGRFGAGDIERISKEMTAEQIDEAIRLSTEWQDSHPSYRGTPYKSTPYR